MAMLPAGFKSHTTEAKYEQSSKTPVDGRGGPPTHNAEGYKQMNIGQYSDGWSDAAKGEDMKKGGTDDNTSKAPPEVSLAISEPAVYSRDWSGK